MKAYLVKQLVEKAKFVGCKHKPTQSYARRAPKNGTNCSKWLHVWTRKQIKKNSA